MRILISSLLIAALSGCVSSPCICGHQGPKGSPLVLMTDFSLRDGAVSAMKGVAYQVESGLVVSDLTHEVTPYNIWEGAYRLNQTYKFWPKGTVFVTVVDPGVGSSRRSIVVKTQSGHYFVGPDNGLYTLIDDSSGIEQVRVLDEAKQRLQGSAESNTFHGRDLYVYVGAKLAAGHLTFEQTGEVSTLPIEKLKYQKAEAVEGKLKGMIAILDINFGNVWTNISKELVEKTFPGATALHVRVLNGKTKIYESRLQVASTFAQVPVGQPLLFFNSLLNLSLALNQEDFAKRFKIAAGPGWTVEVSL